MGDVNMSAYTDMYKTSKKQNRNINKQDNIDKKAQNDFGQENQDNQRQNKR
jgi:hypothetical protein